MVKIYKSSENKGKLTIEKASGISGITNYRDKIEKTVEILAGDGQWKDLHGIKLMIDPTGICIKGPDIFISRYWKDLKNISYQDIFGVMLSVQRATGKTNKSFEDEIDKQNKTKIWQEAVETLNKCIEASKKSIEALEKRQNFI